MSTDLYYKSGVEESNGDVTSGLPRPLAPETTSGRNLENHKTLKNSETAADRRVKHKETKTHLRSANRTVILFPVSGAAYCRFPLPVHFVNMKKRK
jgi:hypothetical protein